MDILQALKIDDLQEITNTKCPTYVHRDHRWDLCTLYHHQQLHMLPIPCDLIMFDQHHDCVSPNCTDILKDLRSNGFDFNDLFELCRKNLSKQDDDWVIAGMELGLIKNAVIFGVHDIYTFDKSLGKFKDQTEQIHQIEILGRPRSELRYQGKLSDLAYGKRYQSVWDLLRWRFSIDDHNFNFGDQEEQLWLNIDLDYFAINWGDYTIPWNDDIFATEFIPKSNYSSTEGWSARDFILGLLNLAGLFTIATEPTFCGGFNNMMQILERFNKFVFDGNLDIPRLSKIEEE